MINVSIIHHESLRFASSNNVLDKKVKKLICLIVPHNISKLILLIPCALRS